LKNEIKKNSIKKRDKKQTTWVNLLKLQLESCDWDNPIEKNQNKLWNSILNQSNIEGQNWKKNW
jgi:hypothetical protein